MLVHLNRRRIVVISGWQKESRCHNSAGEYIEAKSSSPSKVRKHIEANMNGSYIWNSCLFFNQCDTTTNFPTLLNTQGRFKTQQGQTLWPLVIRTLCRRKVQWAKWLSSRSVVDVFDKGWTVFFSLGDWYRPDNANGHKDSDSKQGLATTVAGLNQVFPAAIETRPSMPPCTAAPPATLLTPVTPPDIPAPLSAHWMKSCVSRQVRPPRHPLQSATVTVSQPLSPVANQ